MKEGDSVESLMESLTESEKTRCSKFDGKMYVCKDEDYKKEMDYLKEKVDAGAGELVSFICHTSYWIYADQNTIFLSMNRQKEDSLSLIFNAY